MLALVVIDQGNSEHEVLWDLLHFPTTGEAITVDERTCIVDRAEMVPGVEHELLVLCHLDAVPHEPSPSAA